MSSVFVTATFYMANKLLVYKVKAAKILVKYPVLLRKLPVSIISVSIRDISLVCVITYKSTFRNTGLSKKMDGI